MPPVAGADWTGQRVVVRRVAARDGPRPAFQDVLGDLITLDDDELTIETRAGLVAVARADVVSARLVRPAGREVLALEAVASRGWRAREVQTSSDGWLLRADRGWTGRANSALALATLRRPLDDVVAEVTAWYAARDLPARIQVPQPEVGRLAGFAAGVASSQVGSAPSQVGSESSQVGSASSQVGSAPSQVGVAPSQVGSALGDALDRRGWVGADHTDVLVARLDLLAARATAQLGNNAAVRLDATPDDNWLAGYHYRGRGPLPPGAAELLSRHDRVGFARVESDGAVVAIGRGAVDDGWLGITALDVAATQRRHGLATAVVLALARWGSSAGAARTYVQTDRTNAGAHRFFARLGFHRHHSYHYRLAPTIGP